MLSAPKFIDFLCSLGIDFFSGVPDSLLKSFCAALNSSQASFKHIIAANEGGAIALGAGHWLASRRIPCIYMQNSGIGNAVNPLLSLCDEEVYAIPALLLVGWRGMPGVQDEPQHIKQGAVTPALFDAMEIPYVVLSDRQDVAFEQVKSACEFIVETGRQMALIVRKNTFEPFPLPIEEDFRYPAREEAIESILKSLPDTTAVVGTTGMISREIFEFRTKNRLSHESDFLTVGSMGHASQIALGIAVTQPERTVACLDGDGAFLMHLGAQAIIGHQKPERLIHFILNNGAHDSVGGQPTVALQLDIPSIAKAMNYSSAVTVSSIDQISNAIYKALHHPGPHLIEVRVRKGARPDLGRPTTSPAENKEAFMNFLT